MKPHHKQAILQLLETPEEVKRHLSPTARVLVAMLQRWRSEALQPKVSRHRPPAPL